MNTKHTPGPWSARNNQVYAKVTCADGTVLLPTICLVNTNTTSADSNAKLIAAAPDLFEACLTALKALPDSEQDSELFWKLKNALRKAERGE